MSNDSRTAGTSVGSSARVGIAEAGWEVILGEFLANAVKVLAVVLLAALLVLAMMQIVWRYLLQHSLSWSEELARYLFVWVIALGAALALKNNSHIRLDLVVESLPQRMQLPLFWIGRVAMIVVWVVLGLATLDLLPVVSLQKSPALGLSMFWPYLSVLVGALLMLAFTLLDCIGHLKGSRSAPTNENAGEDSR